MKTEKYVKPSTKHLFKHFQLSLLQILSSSVHRESVLNQKVPGLIPSVVLDLCMSKCDIKAISDLDVIKKAEMI